MTNLLIIVFGVSNLFSQWYFLRPIRYAWLQTQIPKPEPLTYVSPTHPDLVNPNTVNQEGSVIVEPKSPQLVAWEEQEELRKLNLKPTK